MKRYSGEDTMKGALWENNSMPRLYIRFLSFYFCFKVMDALNNYDFYRIFKNFTFLLLPQTGNKSTVQKKN